jgi:mono/diheme cytochrome c family protein
MSARLFLLFVAALVSAALAPAADKKAPPWEQPLQKGRYLYLQNCSICHEINKPQSTKLGPSLFRLYQNEKLPSSGGTPSEEYFRIKVMFGGDVMPPYVNRLSEEEIRLLSDFVRSKK